MVEDGQDAVVAGSYLNNLALIRIPEIFSYFQGAPVTTLSASGTDVPSVAPANDTSDPATLAAKLGTFVHEYYHYLHNVSTMAGVYDLVAQLKMARIFRETVDDSGASAGSSVLPPKRLEEYQLLYQWIVHLRGHQKPPDAVRDHRRDVRLTVVGLTPTEQSFALQEPPIPGESMTLTLEISSTYAATARFPFKLGSVCLTEALAWEADHIIEGADRDLPSDSATGAVPYRVARAVLEYKLGHEVDAHTLMRTCLLALQSSNPGADFVRIAHYMATAEKAGRPIAAALDECTADTLGGLREGLTRIVTGMLNPEFSSFEGIKPIGRAFKFLKDRCSEYVAMRCEDPFFELGFLAQGLDLKGLSEVLSKFPCCPVMQPGAAPHGGSFFVFGTPVPDVETVVALGSFQGFMDFFSAHRWPNEIRPTSALGTRDCPFFTACRAPQTQSNPATCTTKPWLSFSKPLTPEKMCWYSGGVVGAMGRAPARS